MLRQGTNFIECQPRMEDGFTRCYNKALAPRRDLEAKLRAEKKTDAEVTAAVQAAIKAGTLATPPKAMMSYRGYDKRDRIQRLWVMSMPGATPETTGVSTGSQRDDALEGRGLPWMMLAGTPGAHVMIPINPAVKETKITDVARTRFRRRRCPCPRTSGPAPRSTPTTRPPARVRCCAKARTPSSACRRAMTGSPGATAR